MSKMTFHESYGELPVSLLAMYRVTGVTPAEHDMLTYTYGDDFQSIQWAVQRNSPKGYFSSYHWQQEFVY